MYFFFSLTHSLIYFGLTAVLIQSALCVNQGNLLTLLPVSVVAASGLLSSLSPWWLGALRSSNKFTLGGVPGIHAKKAPGGLVGGSQGLTS